MLARLSFWSMTHSIHSFRALFQFLIPSCEPIHRLLLPFYWLDWDFRRQLHEIAVHPKTLHNYCVENSGTAPFNCLQQLPTSAHMHKKHQQQWSTSRRSFRPLPLVEWAHLCPPITVKVSMPHCLLGQGWSSPTLWKPWPERPTRGLILPALCHVRHLHQSGDALWWHHPLTPFWCQHHSRQWSPVWHNQVAPIKWHQSSHSRCTLWWSRIFHTHWTLFHSITFNLESWPPPPSCPRSSTTTRRW
jgi:hypothetical protein